MSAPVYEYHPACLLLPEMTEQGYRELVEDIREHGLREPILRAGAGGSILDGRHRLRGCLELGIEPRFKVYIPPLEGAELEAAYVTKVMSLNIHRRHLTTQQRAHIAAELATMKRGGDQSKPPIGGSVAEAAEMLNVPVRSVERAKARMRDDPEAHELAKAGKLPRRINSPPPRGIRPRGMTQAEWDAHCESMDRERAPSRAAQPEPPAVDMVPANDALLIPWLRSGDVAQVAHRLRIVLGDDRMREIWAHVPPKPAPPAARLPLAVAGR